MKDVAFTRDQCREIDRRAIEKYGISGLVLMENAGRGCVDVLEQLEIDGSVIILCGKGNNAGDGFVIARHLTIRGYECRVLMLFPPDELRGDAATNFSILQKCDVPILAAFDEISQPHQDAAWFVDALLGTGAVGEPRPPFDTAIDWINAHPPQIKVLAVDVPSGLDCDTGVPASHAVPSIVAVVAARKPAAIHCSVSWPTWNSSISAGNATLTIVEARIVDTVPSIIVATTSARVVLAVGSSRR